ncbi:hypothetical protein Acr_28g0002980 [Actinidia rufa]|uniref:Uncharacterized protein n=1 Tax=Actinidia rufa TaxID=165716 RepID=A0A7J0H913_9ERIC|nr:hypothetical protein Acr_28g0002980 [Actinidia rufa]
MWPCVRAGFTLGANQAGDNYSRQVAEVRFKSFLEGWLSYLKELGVPEDNPAWTRAAPVPEFPESPTLYSPLIFPVLNEEEFLIRPEENEVVPEPIPDLAATPDIEAADLAEEVRRTVAEVRLRVYLVSPDQMCGTSPELTLSSANPSAVFGQAHRGSYLGLSLCRMKFMIRSIPLGLNSVLIKTDSQEASRLGTKNSLIAMVQPASPLKIDTRPAKAFACEVWSLSTCLIFTALNSIRRFFTTAKDLQLASEPKPGNEGFVLSFVVCHREVHSEALFKDLPLEAFQNYSSPCPLTIFGSVYEHFLGPPSFGQDSDDTTFGLSSLLCANARQPCSGLTAQRENFATKSARTCPFTEALAHTEGTFYRVQPQSMSFEYREHFGQVPNVVRFFSAFDHHIINYEWHDLVALYASGRDESSLFLIGFMHGNLVVTLVHIQEASSLRAPRLSLLAGVVSNPGEEFVDWFFENHIDPLPHPTFKIDGIVPSLREESLVPRAGPSDFLCLLAIVLQPSKYFNPRHKVPETDSFLPFLSVKERSYTLGHLVLIANQATNNSVNWWKFSIDPEGNLSNHFNPRSLRFNGNIWHIKTSIWFQRAIIYLTCNESFGSDIPLFATASSFSAEDSRACRSRQLGGDHYPSKVGVPSNVNRTPAQGRLSLLTSDSPSKVSALSKA